MLSEIDSGLGPEPDRNLVNIWQYKQSTSNTTVFKNSMQVIVNQLIIP